MTAYLDTDLLHVGQVAEGTQFESYGPVLAIEPCGCSGCVAVFAHGVEVPIRQGARWPIAGAA